MTRPPQLPGNRLLGNLPAFIKDPAAMFQRGLTAYGPVFSIRLAQMRGVVVVGADLHEQFYDEVDRRLSVADLYQFVVPMFGAVALAEPDRERRLQQVQTLHSAFAEQRLVEHRKVMLAEATDTVAALDDTADLWELCEGFSLRTSSHALLGPQVRAEIEQFRPLLTDLARGMEFVLPPWLPLPRFIRRDRARRRLAALIQPMIDARRAQPVEPRDFLQVLVDAEGTEEMGGADLVGMTLLTLFTGYISTAATMAWVLADLADHPEVQDRVAEIAAGDLEAARRDPYLLAVILESLRLHPVMSHYSRVAVEPIDIAGYQVPKGWQLIVVPSLAHADETHYPDSGRYRPERFAEDPRGAHTRPPVFLGFSAGQYRCPGRAFGIAEIATLLVALLREYRLTAPTSTERPLLDLGVIRPADRTLTLSPRAAVEPEVARMEAG